MRRAPAPPLACSSPQPPPAPPLLTSNSRKTRARASKHAHAPNMHRHTAEWGHRRWARAQAHGRMEAQAPICARAPAGTAWCCATTRCPSTAASARWAAASSSRPPRRPASTFGRTVCTRFPSLQGNLRRRPRWAAAPSSRRGRRGRPPRRPASALAEQSAGGSPHVGPHMLQSFVYMDSTPDTAARGRALLRAFPRDFRALRGPPEGAGPGADPTAHARPARCPGRFQNIDGARARARAGRPLAAQASRAFR